MVFPFAAKSEEYSTVRNCVTPSAGTGVPKPRYPVAAVENAAAILDYLSTLPDEAGIASIAPAVGLPPSTVHRLLDTLCWLGYASRNPQTRRYKLGLKLFDLGCTVVNQMGFGRAARQYLEELVSLSGETANLAVLSDDGKVLYIDKVDSPQVLRSGIHVGYKAPLTCTALGKVLLAWLPEDEVDRLTAGGLERRTKNSIADAEVLRAHLRQVREQGYATDDEELMIGIRCVAAPIFNRHGNVVAGLSISGPSSRLGLAELRALAPELIRRAALISRTVP